MTELDVEGIGAWMVIVSVIWAVVLYFSDPSLAVLSAMVAASIGLLLLTMFDDDDQDDSPPTADDLK